MTARDFLSDTRTFYDAVAGDYAELFSEEPARPMDRAVLGGFAEIVGRGGVVVDLGCGPGRVTRYLGSLGLVVSGVDLSEGMLAVARRENPGIAFELGSMTDLPHEDGSVDGVVSWYSSIHTPEPELPALFAEFLRVLRPGGHLLLAFQAGDEVQRHDQPWGHPVALDFLRREPELMTELLVAGGFEMRSWTVREHEPSFGEKVRQAYLIARKPQGE
ncbi:class I SAM-dependent methyltransferase [Streptomyces sp. NPDC088254]|uniref:class I SAM-dependent methyltransferase n=1 Tax=Streptomyces sp. NPDC088254 TaxID=3365847 RepID=UPI0037F62164